MAPHKVKWLQVRMSPAEREVLAQLAASYGLDSSNFVRTAIAHIDKTRPVLDVYPILEDPAALEEDETGRSRWMQIRISEEERARLDAVAADYGLDASRFVRIMIGHFRVLRPKLHLISGGGYRGKAEALVATA